MQTQTVTTRDHGDSVELEGRSQRGLVRLGDGENTLEAQPSEITLDRVWIHGTPTTSTKNGAVFNGRSLALIDSWIDQLRWKGIESHVNSVETLA